MSDTQRDREERQHVIKVLQKMVDWMQEIDDIATPERIHALFYAIASIKTDLKYDLLYEETSGQADKNDLGVTSGLEKNSKKLDCISRADAIKAIQDKAKKLTNEDTINGLCGAVAILFDLPPVTPIRTKGHWISHGEHCKNLGVIPSVLGAYEWCSNCDCGIDVREWHRNHYNYCPNCGSDNREVEE